MIPIGSSDQWIIQWGGIPGERKCRGFCLCMCLCGEEVEVETEEFDLEFAVE